MNKQELNLDGMAPDMVRITDGKDELNNKEIEHSDKAKSKIAKMTSSTFEQFKENLTTGRLPRRIAKYNKILKKVQEVHEKAEEKSDETGLKVATGNVINEVLFQKRIKKLEKLAVKITKAEIKQAYLKGEVKAIRLPLTPFKLTRRIGWLLRVRKNDLIKDTTDEAKKLVNVAVNSGDFERAKPIDLKQLVGEKLHIVEEEPKEEQVEEDQKEMPPKVEEESNKDSQEQSEEKEVKPEESENKEETKENPEGTDKNEEEESKQLDIPKPEETLDQEPETVDSNYNVDLNQFSSAELENRLLDLNRYFIELIETGHFGTSLSKEGILDNINDKIRAYNRSNIDQKEYFSEIPHDFFLKSIYTTSFFEEDPRRYEYYENLLTALDNKKQEEIKEQKELHLKANNGRKVLKVLGYDQADNFTDKEVFENIIKEKTANIENYMRAVETAKPKPKQTYDLVKELRTIPYETLVNYYYNNKEAFQNKDKLEDFDLAKKLLIIEYLIEEHNAKQQNFGVPEGTLSYTNAETLNNEATKLNEYSEGESRTK